MKNVLLTLALMLTGNLFAIVDTNAAYQINRASRLFRQHSVGSQLGAGGWLKGQWSFSRDGGAAGTTIVLKDDDGNAARLPDNAIIDDCLVDVITAPASSTSSAKISFNSNAVGDIKASTAIYPTYQTADVPIVCLPTGNISTAIKMASEGFLKMSVGSEALTAGKINVWVSYVISN